MCIFIIPIKHNSVRVPEKNFRDLNGKPLYYYIINTVLQVKSLKKLIISLLLEGNDKNTIKLKISQNFEKLIKEVNENSSIHIIAKAKDEEDIFDLFTELLNELKELNNLKKIESLEKELINNLDENSYSELIKLKSQLNRE